MAGPFLVISQYERDSVLFFFFGVDCGENHNSHMPTPDGLILFKRLRISNDHRRRDSPPVEDRFKRRSRFGPPAAIPVLPDNARAFHTFAQTRDTEQPIA